VALLDDNLRFMEREAHRMLEDTKLQVRHQWRADPRGLVCARRLLTISSSPPPRFQMAGVMTAALSLQSHLQKQREDHNKFAGMARSLLDNHSEFVARYWFSLLLSFFTPLAPPPSSCTQSHAFVFGHPLVHGKGSYHFSLLFTFIPTIRLPGLKRVLEQVRVDTRLLTPRATPATAAENDDDSGSPTPMGAETTPLADQMRLVRGQSRSGLITLEAFDKFVAVSQKERDVVGAQGLEGLCLSVLLHVGQD
jgi:hypothetical protein